MSDATARAVLAALLLVTAVAAPGAQELEVSGFVALDGRLFSHQPTSLGIKHNDASLVLQPEFYMESEDRRHSVLFVPFQRITNSDPERTHFDIRELLYHRFEDRWELRVGIGQVFWGVTESRHLVDIINQTDRVENVDNEVKLGQPMLNLTLKRDWGTLDAFVLPWFRERTFPGRRGRVRTKPFIDEGEASYESSAKQRHVDFAIRFSRSQGDWDLGLAHFMGTSRVPRLIPRSDGAGRLKLIPRYDQIHQTSLDLQATKGAMLWKLEAIARSGQGSSFLASVAGGEYTLFGVGDTSMDLGLLAELMLDGRGSNAPQPFESDLFLGVRLGVNNEASTEVLAGVYQDLDRDGRLFSVEASTRLSDHWTAELEMRIWSSVRSGTIFSSFEDEDYLQLSFKRYF